MSLSFLGTVSVFLVSLSASLPADSWASEGPRSSPTVIDSTTVCGQISYDPQGGSLIINRVDPLVTAEQQLGDYLVAQTSSGAIEACLSGEWMWKPNRKYFWAAALVSEQTSPL
jgi:uncharacterized iron-regulated membrane protein